MKKTIAIIAVLLASMVFTSAVMASDGRSALFDDEVVFFGTFRLESGDILDGNLVVFGGVVTLEEESEVTGDVLVFGGNVTASGTVGNNLVAIGGVVRLEGTAIVKGDLIAPATVVRRDEQARIFGQIITENIPEIEVPEIEQPEMPEMPELPEITPPNPTFFNRLSTALRPVVSFFGVIARALIFSAVAVLAGLVLPKNTTVVRETIERQPVLSGGFGLLSMGVFVAAVILLALLSITVILIPLTVSLILLLSLGVTLGSVYGLIAIGGEVGRRIMEVAKQDWTPTLQTAIGAFGLTFLLGLLSLGLWGFLGGLLWTVAGAVGLGSVLLTRFGTQAYVPASEGEAARNASSGVGLIEKETEELAEETEGETEALVGGEGRSEGEAASDRLGGDVEENE
ncbi:MAG: hypothetical protein JW757_00780 [Anaerolineales bacterium]|nr:hypothetical protein [Anaerolineales bacterium]